MSKNNTPASPHPMRLSAHRVTSATRLGAPIAIAAKIAITCRSPLYRRQRFRAGNAALRRKSRPQCVGIDAGPQDRAGRNKLPGAEFRLVGMASGGRVFASTLPWSAPARRSHWRRRRRSSGREIRGVIQVTLYRKRRLESVVCGSGVSRSPLLDFSVPIKNRS